MHEAATRPARSRSWSRSRTRRGAAQIG